MYNQYTWKLILLLLLMSFLTYRITTTMVPKENTKSTIQDTTAYANLLADVYIIKKDLLMYDFLSSKLVQELIDTMQYASVKYRVPIGLIHAIIRVESEYKFWVTHPLVTINTNGKKLTTNAVGLGGIIWEFWGDFLKEQGIAESRGDLYLPHVNIIAVAAIVRYIYDVYNINKLPSTQVVPTIVRYYYGIYDKTYYNKLMIVTSDLWIKRISYDFKLRGPIFTQDTLNLN